MKKRDYYAGIDLHSNNLTIAIVNSQGKRIKHAKLFNELPMLEAFLKPFRSRIHTIAVESTYNWYWLVDGIEDMGYHVVLANPAGMEQYNGIKHADDKTDAYFIAELLRLGILPTGHIYNRETRGVRDLFRRRAQMVGKRTAFLLSVRNLHSRTFGSGIAAAHVKSCEPEDLTELFKDPAERLAAMTYKLHIDAFTLSIKRMEKEVRSIAEKMPSYIRLKSIPGIGDILGMTIMMETGDINRFPTAEDFASYSRTVPAKRTTNNKLKGENNRKCGNRYLAWAFIEAANLIRNHDVRARKWFDRKAAKTNRIVATKALACKIAKAAWHILKDGSVYDGARLFGHSTQAARKDLGSAKEPCKGVGTKPRD